MDYVLSPLLFVLMLTGCGVVAQERLTAEVPAVLLTTDVLYINSTEDPYSILTCTAYGNPLPDVTWLITYDNESQILLPIGEDVNITNTQVVTEIDQFTIESLVSVLIICDTADITEVWCSASNDVCPTDAIGYQRAKFDVEGNFSVEVFFEETNQFCFVTEETPQDYVSNIMSIRVCRPPSVKILDFEHFDNATTPIVIADDNLRDIVISVSVVLCVLLVSVTVVMAICSTLLVAYKRKSKHDTVSMLHMDSTTRSAQYNNLRILPQQSHTPTPAALPRQTVYSKPERPFHAQQDASSVAHKNSKTNIGYSKLRFNWSRNFSFSNSLSQDAQRRDGPAPHEHLYDSIKGESLGTEYESVGTRTASDLESSVHLAILPSSPVTRCEQNYYDKGGLQERGMAQRRLDSSKSDADSMSYCKIYQHQDLTQQDFCQVEESEDVCPLPIPSPVQVTDDHLMARNILADHDDSRIGENEAPLEVPDIELKPCQRALN